MVKIFVASFSRSSNGAISKLVNKMEDKNLHTYDYKKADYILAVGDRKETFDFVLERYRENTPIIHLWAGEMSQGTHDEVYRYSMTLMSDIQLCTNSNAYNRTRKICLAVDKPFNAHIVGNVMLDNMQIDESVTIDKPYDLILYNPPTLLSRKQIKDDCEYICKIKSDRSLWIQPNGDINSDIIEDYVTCINLPRPQFLGLLKNCDRFITNSSCQYYEAPFLIDKSRIISIGERNKERESKYSNMSIPNASDNIIKIFEKL